VPLFELLIQSRWHLLTAPMLAFTLAGAVATAVASTRSSEARSPAEALSRSGEAPVEAPVGSFVDGPHARPRMARPEGDEHPDEFALLITRELNDHSERSLRRGACPRGR